MSFSDTYFDEVSAIIKKLDFSKIEALAAGLQKIRERGGRLFILGVGGSAANASHAVNDFRKLCDFEAYAPTDNVSELTARTNDEGWETVFAAWLKSSRLNEIYSQLVAITGATGNGIAVIDLNSLPEPRPLAYAVPKAERPMREPSPASSRALSIAAKPELRASRVARRIRHLPSTLLLHSSTPHGEPLAR